MSSDESDDEPLSVIAANKKLHPENIVELNSFDTVVKISKKKKRKVISPKRLSVTFKLQKNVNEHPPIIERPADVWLYLKDFNPAGPYSCLLCPEWFINRSKIILHYCLNHKKDFCGICRYFVPDRNTWWSHVKFHTPWPCSQCIENFDTEPILRLHLKTVHQLVHCRLCHFRVTDGDLYNSHLFQKHNVSNVANKDEDILWKYDFEGSPTFFCVLCSKADNLVRMFFNHYMGYHHFTLKCFSSLIAGKDLPFVVNGADVRSEFIEEQLKRHPRYGYVDLDFKLQSCIESVSNTSDSKELLKVLLSDVKHENLSADEAKSNKEEEPKTDEFVKSYEGDEDFDVTLTELVVLERCYFDYLTKAMSDMKSKIVHEISDVKYDASTTNLNMDITCPVCNMENNSVSMFITHMIKMHSMKYKSIYSCRVCTAVFDSQNELDNHVACELGDFKDLWLCQFCDEEFETRQETRKHLTKHWPLLEYDNCFSPHLGFKCMFCPTLFWHEKDREVHQVRVHYSRHKEYYYKCEICNEVLSDKVTEACCKSVYSYPVTTKSSLVTTKSLVVDTNTHILNHFLECSSTPSTSNEEIHIHSRIKCPPLISTQNLSSFEIWFIHHYLSQHTTADKIPLYLMKCSLCCLVLSNIDEMRDHFKNLHPEAKKLYCSLGSCKYKPLSHRKSFKLHVRSIHDPRHRVERNLECTVCGREFPTTRAASAHMVQAHGPGKFKCKLCEEVLHTMDERKLHYLICHPGQHPFECTECGKSFQYKSSLYMHKQEHMPNKQNFTCTYCGKTFLKRDSFREHVQIHEGPRHACSYCPMRFVQRSNMLRHERRHTGERPYACPHCPRSFADKGACNSHSRTHSKDTSFGCMYCGKTFVQKSKLTYHIRKHTGENLETCSICSKMFTSACSLREHMKTHVTKTNAIKCPLCERTYADERYMLRHLRTAHSAARHACPLCAKALTSPAGLRHHVLTHTLLKTFRCKLCTKACSVKRTIVKHLRRRHGFQGNEPNMKDFYTRLEPRECNLGLDEEVMTRIFGPPPKPVGDILIGDYVTVAELDQRRKLFENRLTTAPVQMGADDEDGESSKSDSEASRGSEKGDGNSDNEKEGDMIRHIVKIEAKDYNSDECEQELEPTDFVSVKIEPLDDEDYDVN